MDAMPFLTFQPTRGAGAAEAMETYVGLFTDGRIIFDRRRGPDDGPGEGTVFLAEFTVAGQRIRCSDSVVEHAWNFTPAVSIWVSCDDATEQQRLFDALGDGGLAHMPIDDYGFGRFGWVQDRFGINWQLALSDSDDPPS
ncbi:hypothetical protein GCM10009624_28360 [Gordonia sinesedis]